MTKKAVTWESFSRQRLSERCEMPILYQPVVPEVSPGDYSTVAEVNAAVTERAEHVARTSMFQCVTQLGTGGAGMGCGEMIQVGTAEYIQTLWYVSPSGCSEGDYWVPGEGRAVCPHCGHEVRLYDAPEIVALKRHFASVKDRHLD